MGSVTPLPNEDGPSYIERLKELIKEHDVKGAYLVRSCIYRSGVHVHEGGLYLNLAPLITCKYAPRTGGMCIGTLFAKDFQFEQRF